MQTQATGMIIDPTTLRMQGGRRHAR